MDFDPRWNDDPRDDYQRDDLRREESGRELNQGSRGVSSDQVGSAGNSSQRRYIIASRVRLFVCAK